MNISQNSVILIRVVNGIGIDKMANGYLLDGTPVNRKCYNGRLCYQHGTKRVGYASLKRSAAVSITIDISCPF